MADTVQLEIPGGKFLRRQLPQYQPPLGRFGGDWPQRQRAPRHAGAADGAPAARRFLRARASDRSLLDAEGSADAAVVSTLVGGVRIFRALRRGAAPQSRRMGPSHRQPWRNFPEHGAPPATAAHDRGLASAWPAPDRSVALVYGRQGGATGGQGFSARLLHSLFRP